jgi:hypothetical protein
MMTSPRPTPFVLGLLLAASLAVLPAGFARAQSSDVRIDSLRIGDGEEGVELKGLAFNGANLSRDEIGTLLALDTPGDQRTALAARLKASSASIAEIVIGAPAKGPLTFSGLRAEAIDQGKIRRLTLAGGQGGPAGAGGGRGAGLEALCVGAPVEVIGAALPAFAFALGFGVGVGVGEASERARVCGEQGRRHLLLLVSTVGQIQHTCASLTPMMGAHGWPH